MRFTFTSQTLCSLLLSLAVVGCGGSEGDGGGNGEQTPPPVTDGNWYRPPITATWQWQLQGDLNVSYDVEIYDIDLFDTDIADIEALQADGHRVLCYFSAGSYEDWRPDAGAFDPSELGKPLSGFDDERWLDIRSTNVHEIMYARLDLAVQNGCDGVEPDNVQGYAEDTGFNLTAADQLAFNRRLFNAAHERGLSVALKNDLEQVANLIDYVDLMINEECHQYDECETLQPFIDVGKPVLNAEYLLAYRDAPDTVCRRALDGNLRTLILDEELDDSFRFSCDDDFP